MKRVMSNSIRRTLLLLTLLGARGSAGASEEGGAWAAPSRDVSIHRSERLTLASAWGARVPTVDLPRLVLTVGVPKENETVKTRPLLEPPFHGWQIDALGGAWLSPAVTRSTFLKLLFRF
jgi:hypothetical protein